MSLKVRLEKLEKMQAGRVEQVNYLLDSETLAAIRAQHTAMYQANPRGYFDEMRESIQAWCNSPEAKASGWIRY